MSSFFNVGALSGNNVFSTPVGQRIENATDASLEAENWSLNMEICDMINESPEVARDAMKAIRKRLAQNTGKNYTVIMYTLTLLETCVKNCGYPLHLLVSQRDFIQELVKMIGPKNDPPTVVQEKVLQLIQVWAAAFWSQRELSGVVHVYGDLMAKGIEFPPTDPETAVPIYTPERSVADALPQEQQPLAGSGAQPAGSPLPVNAEQSAKLQSELEIVALNMTILGDMLTALRPGHETADERRLLVDLTQTCHEMQARIVELIGRITHDEITAELLRLNDELNNLFLRQQRYEKNRDPQQQQMGNSAAAVLGAAMGVPVAAMAAVTLNNDRPVSSLIDFNDDVISSGAASADLLTSEQLSRGFTTNAKTDVLAAPSSSARPASRSDVDEFDMLAQSRNMTSGGQADTPIASSTNAQKNDLPNPSDSEFDEMAAWLDKEPNEQDGPEETLTSKEFDRFLAERAAAADTLPTISSQAGARPTANASNSSKSKDEESLMAL